MAENETYGLDLRLENYGKFTQQLGELDTLLENTAKSIQKTADSFAKIKLGDIKFDTSSLKDIANLKLAGKSTALGNIAEKYGLLKEAVKGIDHAAILATNKALSQGAQATKIEDKAKAFGKLYIEFERLSKLQLGPVANLITTILKTLGSGFKDFNPAKLQEGTKAIASIVRALGTIEKVQLSKDLFDRINEIADAIKKLGGGESAKAIANLPQFASGIRELSKAFKTFVSGDADKLKNLPPVLDSVAKSLQTFVNIAKNLNTTGSFANNFTTDLGKLNEVSVAIKGIASAMTSLKGASDAFVGFDKNIGHVLSSIGRLTAEFKNLSLGEGFTESSKEFIGSLKALGDALSNFTRRRFGSLPEQFDKLNEAFRRIDLNVIRQIAPELAKMAPAFEALGPVVGNVNKVYKGSAAASKQLQASKIQLTASVINLGVAFGKLGAFIAKISFNVLRNAVSLTLPLLKNLVSISGQVIAAFAKFNFQIAVKGLQALKFAIVNLPVKAFQGSLQLASNALVLFGKAIASPVTLTQALGRAVIKLEKEFKVFKTGLDIITAPLRLLLSLFEALINVASRVAKALNPFNKSVKEQVKSVGDSAKANQQLEKQLNKTAQATNTQATRTKEYIVQTNGATKATNAFTKGFGVLAGVLTTKAITTAVGRFVSMQIAFRALDTLSRAASQGLTMVRNAVVGIVSEAFNAARSLEDMQRSINVLLAVENMRNSEGQVTSLKDAMNATSVATDEVLQRFQDLAIQSPFSRDDIASAFQLSQAYGFASTDGERLTNVLVDFAAGAGKSGASIREMVLPLGQIRTLGRATTVDLKQLQERGIPAFEFLQQALSEATGEFVSMSDVQDLVTAGMVNADFAIGAIEKGLSVFKGSAGEATESLTGLLNTSIDLKNNTLRAFFEPSFNALRPFAVELLKLENINATIASAQELGKVFAGRVSEAFVTVTAIIKSLVEIFQATPDSVKTLIANIIKFGAIVAGITTAISIFNIAMVALTATFFTFFNPITLAIGVLVAFGTMIATTENGVLGFVANVGKSFSTLPQLVGAVLETVANVMKGGALDASAFEGIEGFFAPILTNIINIVTDADSFIGSSVQMFLGWGKTIVEFFSEGINKGLDSLLNAINNVADVLTFWFKPASPPKVAEGIDTWGFGLIQTWVNGILNGAQSLLPSVGTTLRNILSGTFDGLVGLGFFVGGSIVNSILFGFTTVVSILEGIGAVISGAITQVIITVELLIDVFQVLTDNTLSATEKINGTIGAFSDYFQKTLMNLQVTLVNIFNSITALIGGFVLFVTGELLLFATSLLFVLPSLQKLSNGITDFVNNAQQSFGTFVENSVSSFSSVLSNMVEFGSGLISSFAEGIMSTIDVVANALQALGNMITYWLAPGSPPKLLPDIDDWGTAAAQEFLDGFNKADLDLISDFGSTIEDMLSHLNIEGVNVEEVTRAFATGLGNLNVGDDFGQDALKQMLDLTEQAGPEVQTMLVKYMSLAEAQADLNLQTALYNEELAKAQGTLNSFGTMEELEKNKRKIDTLQNLLNSGQLTQEEQTNVQRQIDKLQAESRLKQLEEQKKKTEETVKVVSESIDLQKQQQKIAETIGDAGKNDFGASAMASAAESAKKANSTLDKMTQAMLKNRLATASTAEKIEILREHLSTLEEGSVEYVNTLTEISKLEQKLATERSKEADALVSSIDKTTDAQIRAMIAAGDYEGALSLLNQELANAIPGSKEYYDIQADIARITNRSNGELSKGEALAQKYGAALEAPITPGITSAATSAAETVSKTGDEIKKKIEDTQKNVSESFKKIGDNIRDFVDKVKKKLDEWIFKNEQTLHALKILGAILVGGGVIAAVTALAAAIGFVLTPIGAVATGIATLVGGLVYFLSTSESVKTAFDEIKNSVGSLFGEFKFDNLFNFSSEPTEMDSPVDTENMQPGIMQSFTRLQETIGEAISILGTYIAQNWDKMLVTTGEWLTRLFLSTWITLGAIISGIIENIVIPTSGLLGMAAKVITAIRDFVFKPIIDAFKDNDTILGVVSDIYVNLFSKLGEVISSSFTGTSITEVTEDIANFFDTAVGKPIEDNINELVNNVLPMLGGAFDLSSFILDIGIGITDLTTSLEVAFAELQAIGDSVAGVFDTIMGVFSGEGVEGTGILANIINTNAAAFKEFREEISTPEFQAALATIGQTLGVVAGAIGAIAVAIIDVALISLLQNFADVIIVIGNSLQRFVTGLQLLFIQGELLQGFGEIFGGVFDLIGGLTDEFGDIMADAVLALFSFVNPEFAEKASSIVNSIADVVATFLTSKLIITGVTKTWTYLSQVFTKVSTSIRTFAVWVSNTSDKIKTLLGTVIGFNLADILRDNLILPESTFVDVYNWGMRLVEEFGKGFLMLPGLLASWIVSWTTTFAEWLAPASPPKFLPNIIEWGKAIAMLLIDGLLLAPLDSLLTLGTNIGTKLQEIDLTETGKAIIQKLADTFTSIDLSTVGTNIRTALTQAIDKIKDISVKIADFLTFDAKVSIKDLSKNLQTAFQTGVNKIKKVTVKVADFLVVSREGEEQLKEKIKAALPNFDALFGEGTTDKAALTLADIFTFNESEMTNTLSNLDALYKLLSDFVNLQAIPEAFNMAMDTLIGFFTGELTFPETIKGLYDSLNSFVNLQAIPDIFTQALQTVLNLFVENRTVEEVINNVVENLKKFAELVGIPQGVVDSISNIFSFLSGEGVDTANATNVANALKEFGNLKGIPDSVRQSLQSVIDFFAENSTIQSTVEAIAGAFEKFDSITGIGSGFIEGIQAIIDLLTGAATFPETVNTIATALSNIATTLNTSLGNPFSEIDFGSFDTTIEGLSENLSGIIEAFQNIIDFDFSGITEAFAPITEAFSTIKQQIDGLVENLNIIPGINIGGVENEEEVTNQLEGVLDNQNLSLDARVEVITDNTNLSEQSAKILTAFDAALKNNTTAGVTNFEKTIEEFISQGFELADLQTLAKEAGEELPAGFEEALLNPRNFLGAETAAVAGIRGVLEAIKTDLGIQSPSTVARDEIGKNFIDGILAAFTQDNSGIINQAVSTFLTQITTASTTLLTQATANIDLATQLYTLDAAVVSTTEQGLTTLGEMFVETFESLTEFLQETLESWYDMFEEFFEEVLDLFEEFATAFLGVLSKLVTDVISALRSLVAQVKALGPEFKAAGAQLGNDLYQGIEDSIKDEDNIEKLRAALVGALGGIRTVEFTAAIKATAEAIGIDFVEGIADGLTTGSTSSTLRDAVDAVTQAIIDRFTQNIDSSSPSKVAADVIGLPLTEGIAVGLINGLGDLLSNIDTVSGALINGIETGLGRNYVTGIADGILSSSNILNNAVLQVVNQSVVVAKQALGIRSPSKVTHDMIGLPYVQGIAKALSNGSGQLIKLSGDLLTTLPDSKQFKLDIGLDKFTPTQQIDVQYNGLRMALPDLVQNVRLNRNQNRYQMRESIRNAKALTNMQRTFNANKVFNQVAQQYLNVVQNEGTKRNTNRAFTLTNVLNKVDQTRLMNDAQAYVVPHIAQKENAIASTTNMLDNRSTIVNNQHNEYHMHLSTTEMKAANRVKKNFNMMRAGNRI